MAQQNDDGQEKTLDPTPQRLERARREGNVPRSPDANQAAAYIGLLVTIIVAAESIGVDFSDPLSSFIANPHLMADAMFGPKGGEFASEIMNQAATGVAPLFLVPFAAVLVSLVAQRAIAFSPEKLLPKLERIDPISNAAQKFGPERPRRIRQKPHENARGGHRARRLARHTARRRGALRLTQRESAGRR